MSSSLNFATKAIINTSGIDMSIERIYNLAVLGLSAIEVRVIKSVCAITAGRKQSYRVQDVIDENNAPDIVLINEESPESMTFWEKFNRARNIPAVFLSRVASERNGYILKRPMVPASILKMLEEISHKEYASKEKRKPSAPSTQHTERSTPAPLASTASVPVAAPSASHSDFRALVVDDSPTVRKQMEIAIKKVGGTVVSVETGEAALAMLEKVDFDMVFLDVVLPGADGYAVCRSIKKSRQTKQLPVIMLTSKSSPFDKIRGNLAGCDTYLTKPVDLKLFQSTIEKYLPGNEVFSGLTSSHP